jgi:hypothetical protein
MKRARRAVEIVVMKAIERKLRSENDRSKLNGFEPPAAIMSLDLYSTLYPLNHRTALFYEVSYMISRSLLRGI